MVGLVLAILIIAVVGFLVYFITTNIKMAEPYKEVIILVSVVFLVLWVLAILTGQVALPTLPKF